MLTTELIQLGVEALQKFSMYPREECGHGDHKSRLEIRDAVYYLGCHWMAVGKNGQFPMEKVSTLAREENP